MHRSKHTSKNVVCILTYITFNSTIVVPMADGSFNTWKSSHHIFYVHPLSYTTYITYDSEYTKRFELCRMGILLW